ncbi:MAG TPA: HpcH/HpaI aldolase/citrate lyase family protein [Pseudonocardia sp.]|jgi:4-hydroxy-2-oxoheptanedioate aldolase|nr:HpcH/HpaI aldolase/citrate lyase family protein [Pseudonocardia sp.]
MSGTPTPTNPFKQALRLHRGQIGLWLGLASAYSAEICAGAGFDWLLVDCEHGPQSLPLVLAQLQAIDAAGGAHAVVRVASDDPVGLKQCLDLGARNVLVPMVETVEQAEAVVRACRYPPLGVRGVGGARASRWGRYPDYPNEATEQTCVLVQVETRLALDNLAAISAIDGIDGVFVGPADLAASMGHLGNAAHPEVRTAVSEAFRVILAAGKPPGVLTASEALAHDYLRAGAVFVAVGLDTLLLARQTEALAARFRYPDGVRQANAGAAACEPRELRQGPDEASGEGAPLG